MSKRSWRWRLGGILSFAAVFAATEAAAQVTYQTLTLVDAQYLWTGLGFQNLLRASPSMQVLPYVVVTCSTLWLLFRRVVEPFPAPLATIVSYLLGAFVITALFWPEAMPAMSPAPKTVRAAEIESIAAAGSGMVRKTAGDVATPGSLGASARVPVFFDAVLKAITMVPIRLGQGINRHFAEPMSEMVGVSNLLFQPLSARLRSLLSAWAAACYRPALEAYRQGLTPPATAQREDIYPWAAPLQAAMAGREITRETVQLESAGAFDAVYTTTPAAVDCNAYYTTMAAELKAWLAGLPTANGSTFLAEVRAATGMSDTAVERFFTWRQLEREVPVAVASGTRTRLQAAYAVGLGASYLMRLAGRQASRLEPRDGSGGGLGPGGQPGTGRRSGVATFFASIFDRLAAFIGPVLAFLMFLPYVTGMVSATVLGLFPVVVIWSLFPGQGFRTLVNYFLVLFFVQSAPLWWAVSDAASRLAFRVFGGGPNILDAVTAVDWVQGQIAAVVAAVCCVVLVPLVESILLFGTWRAISGSLGNSGL